MAWNSFAEMTRQEIAALDHPSRRAELAAMHAEMLKDHLAGFGTNRIAESYGRSLWYVQFVLKLLMRTIPASAWSSEDCARINGWVRNHERPLVKLMAEEHEAIIEQVC